MATNPANIAPSEDADDFDAAFNEIASGNSEPPASEAGDDDDDPDPVPEADGEASPPAGAAAGEEANVADDQSPAGAAPSDDIWANAPPELREAREKELRDLNFRLSSQQGRVSALHRKLQERERQQQPGQDGGGQPEARRADEGGEPANDPLATLKEEYPEIAAPIVATIESLQQQIADLSQPVTSMAEAQAQTFKAQQYGILAQRHPDWQELAQDDRWGGWIEAQPRAVQEAFARNVDVSDGKEAAWVLDLFKADMGISAPTPAPSPTPAPTPAPSPAPTADQRRQKQLDAGRDGGSGGGPTVTNELPDDFDAELDRIQAKRRSRR